MSLDAIDRLRQIEALIQAEGRVRVVDAAVRFDVSEMTIRRDLDVLVEQGIAQRIRARCRGGANAGGVAQLRS